MSSIARMVVVVIAMALACPTGAGAQIASIVRPPGGKRAPAAQPTPYDTSTAQVRHPTTQLTNLTTWVDSAVVANEGTTDVVPAGAPAPAKTAVPKTERAPRGAAAGQLGVMRFQNGAAAPDTASPLPAMVVVGFAMVGLGALVNARGRKRV